MNEEEKVAHAPHDLSNKSGSAEARVKTGIFHRCSACGSEYVIDDPLSIMSMQLENQRFIRRHSLLYPSMTGEYLHFSHKSKSIVTTCSKCGNTDEVV
jgi:hypothetical protein